MVKLVPDLKDAAATSEDLEWPRLRCFLFFKDEDPTKRDHHIRAQTWCLTNLRDLCYEMDKGYSQAASKIAIPQLVNEINVFGEPQKAELRFKSMVSDPELYHILMKKAEKDYKDHKDPLEKKFERVLHVDDEGNRGSGSS